VSETTTTPYVLDADGVAIVLGRLPRCPECNAPNGKPQRQVRFEDFVIQHRRCQQCDFRWQVLLD